MTRAPTRGALAFAPVTRVRSLFDDGHRLQRVGSVRGVAHACAAIAEEERVTVVVTGHRLAEGATGRTRRSRRQAQRAGERIAAIRSLVGAFQRARQPGERLRFVYTPKHCSWLNQIECWFSILVRRVLRRGSFTSIDHMNTAILDFIEYFNRLFAKPFKWTYTGRALTT